MSMRAITAGILLAATLLPAPLHAWDDVGHRVVARIAWESLSPAARAQAAALLLAAPEDSGLPALLPADGRPLEVRERELFEAAACWADWIRDPERPARRYDRPSWHYVNFFWRQDGAGGPAVELDLPLTGELLVQIERVSAALGDRERPATQRGLDLAWLLHLVGDLHQPLHTSARVSPRDPDGDRGGNAFRLGEGNNVHRAWDVVLSERYPRHEGETLEGYIGRVAAAVMEAHPRADFEAALVQPADFTAWAREGLAVAQRAAYPAYLERDAPPPARYTDDVYAAAAPRIALAGYRLAALLEELLGS
nr:MAG: hypothetical protein DIU52_11745 [bacterium]